MKTNKVKITTILLMLFAGMNTFASATDSLPWTSPMKTITDSVTGPLAGFIALIILFACGIVLWKSEFGEFGKKALKSAMAISFICGAPSWLNILFNISGSIIR